MNRWVTSLFVLGLGVRFAMLCKRAGMHSLVSWHRWCSWLMAAGLMGVEMMFCMLTFLIFLEPRGPGGFNWILLTMMALFWGGLLVAGIGFVAATVLLLRTAMRFQRLAAEAAAASYE